MFGTKPGKAAPKLIWRMSAANPRGEYVRPAQRRAEDPPPREAHGCGFEMSSSDLLQGADVSETPMDTLPGELIDAFEPFMPEKGA